MTYFDSLKQIVKKAYAPYSNFYVGCIVKTDDGKTHEGVNVENATYRLTNCAESNALASVIAKGYKPSQIKEVHIAGGKNGKIDSITMPCGSCRQVINELSADDAIIYVYQSSTNVKKFTKEQILPFAFGPKDLK